MQTRLVNSEPIQTREIRSPVLYDVQLEETENARSLQLTEECKANRVGIVAELRLLSVDVIHAIL